MRKIILATSLLLLAGFATGATANDQTDVEAMKMRSLMQRDMDNIFLLYGDKVNQPESCYEAAISNYLSDKWTELAKSFSCANDEALCNKDPKMMAAVEKSIKDSGGDPNDAKARAAAFKFQNAWYLLTRIFALELQLKYALDPNDEISSYSINHQTAADVEKKAQPITPQQKQQNVDELNKYVSSCKTAQPVKWMLPGSPLPANEQITEFSGIESLEVLITNFLVAPQLAAADRGYLGCIWAWNEAERTRILCKDKSCAEIVPKDDKAVLKAKLDELKSQHCDPSNALGMIPITDTAQPVK